MSTPAVEIKGVHYRYRGSDVIDGVDLTIEKGEFFGLIGPNGAGKSTLLRLLSGFNKPRSGSIKVFGRELASLSRIEAARLIAVAPQEISFFFPYRVEDFIMLARHPYSGPLAFDSEDDHAKVIEAMEETDTLQFRDRSVLQLSHGEKQRVLLAAALAQDTGILVLDEPTSALDLKYQVQINSILTKINETRDLTVITATHDLNLSALFCSRLGLLSAGKLVASGEARDILTPEIMREYYGVEAAFGINEVTRTPYVLPIKNNQ